MKKKFFYKGITSLLITSFILVPLSSIPRKAQAQGISSYTSGLAPAILQLPLCRGRLTSATRFLFGGVTDIATGLGATVTTVVDKNLSRKFEDSASISGDIPVRDASQLKRLDAIQEQLGKIQKSTTSLDENDTCLKSIGRLVIKMLLQKITLSTVAWINSGFDGKPAFLQNPSKFFNDIARNEIFQFGLEIDNEGLFPFGKAWLRNVAAGFNNQFADNARYSLDEMIANTTPEFNSATFEADFSQGGWNAWSAMTQNPANNPLGFQLMADREIAIRLDGTSQSVARNTRDALQAASGFLSQERCVSPKGVTRQEHDAALQGDENARRCEGGFEVVTPGRLISEAAINVSNYPNNNLLRAEDLNDAMAAIMDALLSQFSSKLMEEGFAELDGAGADGSFSYGSSYINPGTDYTSPQTEVDFNPTQLASSWLTENKNFDIRTDLTQALIDEQRTYADKLTVQNEKLNSTTDGKDYTSAFNSWIYCADESQTCSFSGTRQVRYGANGIYVYKEFTNNAICNVATFGSDPTYGTRKTCAYESQATGITNASGLIPAIGQLDYCIPGPHPGFEEDSTNALNAIANVIPAVSQEDLKNTDATRIIETAQTFAPLAGAAAGAALAGTIAVGLGLGAATVGATAGSVVPIVGTIIGAAIGVAIGAAIGWLGGGSDDIANVELFYYARFLPLTGVTTGYTGGNSQKPRAIASFGSKGGLIQTLNIILERYINFAHSVYNPKVLPTVYKEATNEFNKLEGYSQIMVNNEETIATTKNIVSTLGVIKDEVDRLNQERDGGTITGDQYEEQLKPQINAFGRISASMVNGDDIASVDNLTKQIIDETNYVYNDLLKGPFGCEKELEGIGAPSKLPDNLHATQRMNYPFPILYTYDVPADTQIPDPWNSGYVNRTNARATGIYGPGFLSSYFFQTNARNFYVAPDLMKQDCAQDENGVVSTLCQLHLEDLLPLRQPSDGDWSIRSLGAIPDTTSATVTLRGQSSDANNTSPIDFTINSDATTRASGPYEGLMGVY